MLIPSIKLTFDLNQAVALARESLEDTDRVTKLYPNLADAASLRPALLFHKGEGVFLISSADAIGSRPLFADGFDAYHDNWRPRWAEHGLPEGPSAHRIDLLAGGLFTHLREAAADRHVLLCITYTEGFAPRVTHPHAGPGTDAYVSGCCPPS
ncbi:hypothetical protein [Actinomadura hibisca]|uniref:hypothetical protein n=1 Tax=Actinomadura hibisca TaxID=68565 RepID=UPI0012FB6C45|nr:hypothetical protein [Actinomadura hibisca]